MHHPLRLHVQASTLIFALVSFVTLAHAIGPSGVIRGRVLDPDRRPVAGATVVILGPAPEPLTTLSDAEGAFEVPAGTAGSYNVYASAPGLSSPRLAVDVQNAPVEVELVLRLSALDEHLVVTASQVDQPLSRVPDSATVIGARTLEARQQFTASQALRSVPGLAIQQSGGPGSLTSMFMRGGESDYTLVLIDGIRANAFGGGVDLSQVPLADVDRIEVIRGPQSALYGADAIGGVVQIVTRSGGRPSVQGLFEAGGRGMYHGAASTTGELGGFRWQLGGDHFVENGFTGRAANGEQVTNDDARTSQGALTIGWRGRSTGTDMQATMRYVETDRGTPGPYGSDPAGRSFGVDRTSRNVTNRLSAGGRWVQPWFGASSRVRQRTELDVADYDLTFQSAFPSEGESRRTHVRTQSDVAASPALGLTAGAEWLGERGSSTFITAGPAGQIPVERSVLGLFAEARWQAATRLSVTAGIRSERIHRDSFPGDPLAFAPRPDFPAETLTSINPKVAASWMVAGDPSSSRAWMRLHGAAGTGIRPPDAFEIAFTDNSGLAPERSRSADLGVAQVLARGAIQLDLTAFFNRYDDLIISVGRSFTGVSRWRTDNISNARARGAEFSAAWRPGPGVSLQAAYTFLATGILAVDGSPDAPPPYSAGDRLLRRPRHQGTIDATWSAARAGAFAQVLVRGQTLDAEPAFGPTGGLYDNPGHAVTNAGASLRVARGVTVQGRLLNLFDARYEEVFGFPAPRRTAYVGVRIAAGR